MSSMRTQNFLQLKRMSAHLISIFSTNTKCFRWLQVTPRVCTCVEGPNEEALHRHFLELGWIGVGSQLPHYRRQQFQPLQKQQQDLLNSDFILLLSFVHALLKKQE
jgi:hypothetical protein